MWLSVLSAQLKTTGLVLPKGSKKAIHTTVQLINQSIAITIPVTHSSGQVLSALLLVVMGIKVASIS